MIGIIPYGGVSFATNEMLKKHWIKKYGKEPNTLEKLFIGGIAGLSGQAASHPLDVVRRRMQTPTGQLISKCPFGVFKSPKKPTNIFPGFLP